MTENTHEIDTINDLVTQLSEWQSKCATLEASAAAHRNSYDIEYAAHLTTRRRLNAAQEWVNEALSNLGERFGIEEVAECLNLDLPERDYEVTVPVTLVVSINVHAGSEEDALERVRNGEFEYEIRDAIGYRYSSEYEQNIEDAEIDSDNGFGDAELTFDLSTLA